MQPCLRPAEISDIPALAALARETYAAAFAHTFEVADDLAAHLDTNLSETAVAAWIAEDHVTLADLAGRIVGFAQYGPTSPAGSYGGYSGAKASLPCTAFYVARDLLNAGLGGTLLREALAVMESAARDIYLDVWEGNRGAQRLYVRHGFEPLGRVKLETASGAGAGYDIVMVRRAG